jgi:hypothetical protein
MHDDCALSSKENETCREDKEETEKRQGLGRFFVPASLPRLDVRCRSLCQSVLDR